MIYVCPGILQVCLADICDSSFILSVFLSFFLLKTKIFTTNQITLLNCRSKEVKRCLDAACLALNIDKTYFVIFHSPHVKVPEPMVIRFCEEETQRENCVKCFRILPDANFSWEYHIDDLSQKLSGKTGIFHKIRNCILFYHTLFYSFFHFTVLVYLSWIYL